MRRESVLNMNIGLEGIGMKDVDLWKHLKRIELFNKGFVFSIEKGNYKGVEERTFVVEGTTPYKFSTVMNRIELLCSVINQDCIAVQYNKTDVMLYNPFMSIPHKDMLKFNRKLFIKI